MRAKVCRCERVVLAVGCRCNQRVGNVDAELRDGDI